MSKGQGLAVTDWQLTRLTMQALYELSQAVGIRRGVAVISYGAKDQAREFKRQFEDRLAQVNVHFHTIHARPARISAIRADTDSQDGLEEN